MSEIGVRNMLGYNSVLRGMWKKVQLKNQGSVCFFLLFKEHKAAGSEEPGFL